MKFSQIIFGAVAANIATVSAVDVYFWVDSDTCHGGTYLKCGGLNPNTCCSVTSSYAGAYSVSYLGIPTDWYLVLGTYRARSCKTLQGAVAVDHTTNHCFKALAGKRDFLSGDYRFDNKKRDSLDAPTTSDESKKECQSPDILGLADGTEFGLAGLDEETLIELGHIRTECYGDLAAPCPSSTAFSDDLSATLRVCRGIVARYWDEKWSWSGWYFPRFFTGL
ncbi:hypothetical protein GLAREA_09756 [Glarea lozoyensis ATCC 20868]|uniref:Uncharacterized protein n=1 Tax=Glarea lozoyensis (strain ATCC 20868 / MF5171) TaxID=1116229 RepID=S3CSJ1_GLAL2|nr:uncharacterized protein GLAREA_09756 [Glarea lozoyensis ATCC 20868]EPE28635.1 hypothetical protein GLAREA_09756 [Glarea lozoyensis ATCC 20868]